MALITPSKKHTLERGQKSDCMSVVLCLEVGKGEKKYIVILQYFIDLATPNIILSNVSLINVATPNPTTLSTLISLNVATLSIFQDHNSIIL